MKEKRKPKIEYRIEHRSDWDWIWRIYSTHRSEAAARKAFEREGVKGWRIVRVEVLP